MSRKEATATPELNGLKSFQDTDAVHRTMRKFASTKIGAAVFRPTSHHLDKLGGGARHPGWYHNLEAKPEATVAFGGATWEAVARPATPRERDEIWAKGVAIYPAYDDYKGRTRGRDIEAFVLSRR